MSPETTSVICEQGDMGLWETPLSESDQQLYNKQNDKETKADE